MKFHSLEKVSEKEKITLYRNKLYTMKIKIPDVFNAFNPSTLKAMTHLSELETSLGYIAGSRIVGQPGLKERLHVSWSLQNKTKKTII